MQGGLFPREVTSNVPRITLTGREQLHIEQHRGLIDYAPDLIVMRTSIGLMRVMGCGMIFRLYTEGEAMVTGQIISVSFDQKEGRA